MDECKPLILGVSMSATEKQIKKAFRVKSMMYHPDKTGNDPVKKEMFMKIQAGAYTRPLLSSTRAVSDTKYALNTPDTP